MASWRAWPNVIEHLARGADGDVGLAQIFQRGDGERREQADDGDDHEQLEEGEATAKMEDGGWRMDGLQLVATIRGGTVSNLGEHHRAGRAMTAVSNCYDLRSQLYCQLRILSLLTP